MFRRWQRDKCQVMSVINECIFSPTKGHYFPQNNTKTPSANEKGNFNLFYQYMIHINLDSYMHAFLRTQGHTYMYLQCYIYTYIHTYTPKSMYLNIQVDISTNARIHSWVCTWHHGIHIGSIFNKTITLADMVCDLKHVSCITVFKFQSINGMRPCSMVQTIYYVK